MAQSAQCRGTTCPDDRQDSDVAFTNSADQPKSAGCDSHRHPYSLRMCRFRLVLTLHLWNSMLAGDFVYWISWLGALALIAVMVFVAWWALFSDRARGKDRRRCPKCWYDMAYSPGMTCAECGFVGWRESQFHKTRRRYSLAVLAILTSVTIVLVINYRVADRGIAALMPTRVLLWLLPIAGDNGASSKGIFGEIGTRAATGRLSPGEWQSLIGRCADGDFRAQPTTDKWVSKYGNLISLWRQTFVNDASLETLLMTIPPRVEATTRETWPENMPITANVVIRDWWPWGMECRIRATPRINNQAGETTTFFRTGDDRWQRSAYALDLPPLANDVSEIMVDFEIARRRMPGVASGGRIIRDTQQKPGEWEPCSKQSIVLKTRVRGTIEQLAAGISNPALDDSISQIFRSGAVKWPSGPSPVRFQINPQATWVPAFDKVAVGLSAELICDDQVARRLNLWWLGGAGFNTFTDRNYGFEIDYENRELLNGVNTADGRWKIRVRGNPQVALRAGTADKYWNGEVEVPLRLQVNPNAAPSRAWWTEEDGGDQQ